MLKELNRSPPEAIWPHGPFSSTSVTVTLLSSIMTEECLTQLQWSRKQKYTTWAEAPVESGLHDDRWNQSSEDPVGICWWLSSVIQCTEVALGKPPIFSKTSVDNGLGCLWKGYRRHRRMFLSVWGIPVKLKLIWQPSGCSSTPKTLSLFFLLYSLAITVSLFPLFFSVVPNVFHHALLPPNDFQRFFISASSYSALNTPFLFFCEATHCISCLQSSMSYPGMCWWLTFSGSFMCASCVATAGIGCSSSKSICHMSNICWVRRFMSRFCGSYYDFSPIIHLFQPFHSVNILRESTQMGFGDVAPMMIFTE